MWRSWVSEPEDSAFLRPWLVRPIQSWSVRGLSLASPQLMLKTSTVSQLVSQSAGRLGVAVGPSRPT